jgi:hypothetical protein
VGFDLLVRKGAVFLTTRIPSRLFSRENSSSNLNLSPWLIVITFKVVALRARTTMSCAGEIINLIDGLSQGALFATKDCLNFGLRNAVDKALSRLVKIGCIVRVARGVFARGDTDPTCFTVASIAAFKASVYNKVIATHGALLCRNFGWSNESNSEANSKASAQANSEELCETTFYVGGCSSSFESIVQRIHFRRSSAKRISTGDDVIGELVRALWHLRLPEPTDAVQNTLANLSKEQQRRLLQSAHLMPNWLMEQFRLVVSLVKT